MNRDDTNRLLDLEAEVERLQEERSLLLHDADEIHAMETANRDLQAEVEALRSDRDVYKRQAEAFRAELNRLQPGMQGDLKAL